MNTTVHLETSLQYIDAESSAMKSCLNSSGKMLLAIKHASNMLGELRTSSFLPKQYYELYVACFDSLTVLMDAMKEDHKFHHLADIYEIVQYTGNILPRLYLMITVGAAYLSVPDAPVAEILKDLLEMCRGVQNPIRGLFLRYYLGQRTRDYLPPRPGCDPKRSLKNSIKFTITNFIEMNKLWVRLQHQGHSREKQKRLEERRELRIIVGSNIVRLSQLEAVDATVFRNDILPALCEQIVQCHDVLAQEYLMDVICQAFPGDFLLNTLDQFFTVLPRLAPSTSVVKISVVLIERLIIYLESVRYVEFRSERNTEAKKAMVEEVKRRSLTNDSDARVSDCFADEQTEAIVEEKANQSVPNITSLPKHVLSEQNNAQTAVQSSKVQVENLAIARNAESCEKRSTGLEDFEYLLDTIWKGIEGFKSRLTVSGRALLAVSIVHLQVKLNPKRQFQTVLDFVISEPNCPALDRDEESDVGQDVSDNDSANDTRTFSRRFRCAEVYDFLICLLENFDLESLLQNQLFQQIISLQETEHRKQISAAILDGILRHNTKIADDHLANQIFDLFLVKGTDVDAALLARVLRLLDNEDFGLMMELFVLARKKLKEAGVVFLRNSYSALTFAAAEMLCRWKDDEKIAVVFKFLNHTIHDISYVGSMNEEAIRLYSFAALLADDLQAEQASYEFFVQAFIIYEEAIAGSRAQFEALSVIIGRLQKSRSFSRENYETLASRCLLYSGKLLRKDDQCRTLCNAAYLWMATERTVGIERHAEIPLYRNDAKALETLQRALHVADECMDANLSIELFIEVLEHYIVFYQYGSTTVTTEQVNSLIELIHKNFETVSDAEPAHRHFMRTLDFVVQEREHEPRLASLRLG